MCIFECKCVCVCVCADQSRLIILLESRTDFPLTASSRFDTVQLEQRKVMSLEFFGPRRHLRSPGQAT